MLHVWLIDELYLDGGKSLDPRPEVIGEDEGTTTALHRAQLARLNCCVERRPARARDGACLRNAEGQCVHFHLAIWAWIVQATVLACSRAVAKGVAPP